jgi:hypothetical protein
MAAAVDLMMLRVCERRPFHKQSVLIFCSIYMCFSLATPKPPSSVAELPSTPKIKQQSSITNSHSETGNFHIKSMPKCGKFGAASTAGWGAGAAIFSPVGRVVLLHPGPHWPGTSSGTSTVLASTSRYQY